jgi:hypothetical protein
LRRQAASRYLFDPDIAWRWAHDVSFINRSQGCGMKNANEEKKHVVFDALVGDSWIGNFYYGF